MASLTYPLSADTLEGLKKQLTEIIRSLFEDRIGGLALGDVFTAGGDVLTLHLIDDGGLKKLTDALGIDIYATGGLSTGTNGLQIKCKAAGGLATDAAGIYATTPVVKQAAIPDVDPATGCYGVASKVNAILAALRAAGIIAV